MPPDPAGFERVVMAAGQPVVMRGLCAHWPVVVAARQSPECLREEIMRHATDRQGQAFRGRRDLRGHYFYKGEALDGFNFERVNLTIGQAFDEIFASVVDVTRDTFYMGSLAADIFLPGFADDNNVPMLPRHVVPRLWIGNASNVACHYDSTDNIACVVAGRRRFTLYPPDAIGDLYVGPIDNTMAGQPVSLAAVAAPGDARFPRFEAARSRALTVELAPGDALYLPKLWWHQVEATEPFNVLVNYWWDGFATGPDNPQTMMMLAMIAIADRPLAERAAWRAYFDHYVFRLEGHPLAHVPPGQHGILGPLAGGMYGRIRAMLMQRLRGG
ncbi:MAG: cupin-like domain-containing protein [Sphingomonadales bacterium]|nr:cupin-like domain-containing protein [Sphingomonadales bacterium]MDE2168505.1 cupin-like domain-containing protein [Sphingomonadales bacterium]